MDMLSGLPDEVIYHILSFLPTKLSGRTSVLAKRWRFLWTHVPNLQFSGLHANKIYRVIMLHEAKTVNTFRLSNVRGSAYQLETLIIYPIKRSVRNLYLDFGDMNEEYIVCDFPSLLLTCKTLVDLKLVSCGVIPSSGELLLPSLKKLNLSYVEYEDDKSLLHLLSGCPVLEELIVNDYFREGQKNSGCVIVSSPTIKTLNVDFSMAGKLTPDKILIIDVPALIYLKVLRCRLYYVKSLSKPMTSLIEAEITLDGYWHACDIDCTKHGPSIEFLSCLCHVRYLKISSGSGSGRMLVDIVGTGSVAKFVNLTKLELGMTVNWYNLVKFLEVADNLEVLIFELCETASYKEPKRVPRCMLSLVRTVRIKFFRACQDALDIVRYILRNAQVLERMEISPLCCSSDKEMLDTLQTISLCERVSKSCQVAFDREIWNAN